VTTPVRASAWWVACAALAITACSPENAPQSDPGDAGRTNAAIATAETPERECNDDPRPGEEGELPRCVGIANADAPQAYRVVGGSGDPVDQVVCDIESVFVLDGKLFGVELSGGVDGTYRFVRTPNVPGVSWSAGGRYHVEFPDGRGRPGTMTTEGGGTTTAGRQSRNTTGGERFTLTPTEACKP
jgi:hypothetical protein